MRNLRDPHPTRRPGLLATAVLVTGLLVGCAPEAPPASDDGAGREPRRSILLVTLDTTRADVVGYAGGSAETPALDRLAAAGVRFERAYATAPMTLPSHASMMTGLYPAGHGLHENGRSLDRSVGVVAERLRDLGYSTGALVSGYPLARQFGLARGFVSFDDSFAHDAAERTAGDTTAAAIGLLAAERCRKGVASKPLFLWVHYFDAHDPFTAPAEFASRHPADPYAAEVAYVDHEMGRLVDAFRERCGEDAAIVVVGDHGEGLGDHGEQRHGNLLYDGVMRVPLVIAAPGRGLGPEPSTPSPVTGRSIARPVSVRRVFHTLLDLAGAPPSNSLLREIEAEAGTAGTGRTEAGETVLAEAMKPYLNYGWQPQVMAVTGDALRHEGDPLGEHGRDCTRSPTIRPKIAIWRRRARPPRSSRRSGTIRCRERQPAAGHRSPRRMPRLSPPSATSRRRRRRSCAPTRPTPGR